MCDPHYQSIERVCCVCVCVCAMDGASFSGDMTSRWQRPGSPQSGSHTRKPAIKSTNASVPPQRTRHHVPPSVRVYRPKLREKAMPGAGPVFISRPIKNTVALRARPVCQKRVASEALHGGKGKHLINSWQ